MLKLQGESQIERDVFGYLHTLVGRARASERRTVQLFSVQTVCNLKRSKREGETR